MKSRSLSLVTRTWPTVLVCFYTQVCTAQQPPAALTGDVQSNAVMRAVDYLSTEVPRWSAENRCFSCHNNGDAARALYAALELGEELDGQVLRDTTAWLVRPKAWKDNGGDPAFSDKTLATLQFAAALARARSAGQVDDQQALAHAAQLVADLQQADGSWKLEGPETLGSPATWGATLSTAMARQMLAQADMERFGRQVELADQWLRQFEPVSILDAAALLIGLGGAQDGLARQQRQRALDLITKGQSQAGGWGSYHTSPPEAFDTAVVLIGLSSDGGDPRSASLVARGRQFLIETQRSDGSWAETTRPARSTSYAQRISTSGWATQALLETAAKRAKPK